MKGLVHRLLIGMNLQKHCVIPSNLPHWLNKPGENFIVFARFTQWRPMYANFRNGVSDYLTCLVLKDIINLLMVSKNP